MRARLATNQLTTMLQAPHNIAAKRLDTTPQIPHAPLPPPNIGRGRKEVSHLFVAWNCHDRMHQPREHRRYGFLCDAFMLTLRLHEKPEASFANKRMGPAALDWSKVAGKPSDAHSRR